MTDIVTEEEEDSLENRADIKIAETQLLVNKLISGKTANIQNGYNTSQYDLTEALDSYLGYATDTENDDSPIVRIVYSFVNQVMPSIMKTFGSSEKSPFRINKTRNSRQSEEQNKQIDQRNESIEKEIERVLRKNSFFELFQTTTLNSFIYRLGVIHSQYENKKNTYIENHENIPTEEAFNLLLGSVQESGKEVDFQESLWDDSTGEAIVKCYTYEDSINLENIAPENFIYDKTATHISNASFIGIKKSVPDYELIDAGYDIELFKHDVKKEAISGIKEKRIAATTSEPTTTTNDNMVWMYEFYLRDENGTMLKVICFGDGLKVGSVEEWHYPVPISLFKVKFMPNVIPGASAYDELGDLQDMASGVLGAISSFAETSGKPKYIVKPNQVDASDFYVDDDVIFADDPAAVNVVAAQNVSQDLYKVFELVTGTMLTSRVGANLDLKGMSEDGLAGTSAIAAAAAQAGAGERVELTCRNLSVGYESLMMAIIGLMSKYYSDPLFDFDWHSLDIDIEAGLGSADKNEKMAGFQAAKTIITEANAAGIGDILSNPEKVAELGRDLIDEFEGVDANKYINGSEEIKQILNQKAQEPETEDPLSAAERVKGEFEQQMLYDKQMFEAEKYDLELEEVKRKNYHAAKMAELELQIKAEELEIKREDLAIKRLEKKEK